MRLLSLSLFLVFAAISLPLHAADVSIPNQFTGGQKAIAADVNENFALLAGALNDAVSRIALLEAQNTQLMTDNQTLEDRLATIENSNVLKLDPFVDVLDGVEVYSRRTVRFSEVNVQVVDGTGTTVKNPGNENGLGNLIVGYNEAGGIEMCARPGDILDAADCDGISSLWHDTHKTGTHNLVVGTFHNYAGSTGIVAGFENGITGIGSSVLGGEKNAAIESLTSVVGGRNNRATREAAVTVGGQTNHARGSYAVVVGGNGNRANSASGVALGGSGNHVNADVAVAVGGSGNRAGIQGAGANSVVLGGSSNTSSMDARIHPSPTAKPSDWQP